MATRGGLGDLPLIELSAARPPGALAVILSGDGGWRDVGRAIGRTLSQAGIAVVGLDSLRYFWREKTPEQVGRDLDRILEHYQANWRVDDVMLIGYSFGAGVLPAAYNRMNPATRTAVVQLSLLGLAQAAPFAFRFVGWFGLTSSDARPIAPEVARLDMAKVQCVYGEQEVHSLCRSPLFKHAELIETKGGHHFDGDYQALARRIIQGYERRKHA